MNKVILIFPLLLAVSCRPAVESLPTTENLIRDTAEYLWKQQDEDGGWHSPTHGIASGGESWTPFVLYHLLQVPDTIFSIDGASVQAGLGFVRNRISESGILGNGDPVVSDYPNYASAYALLLLDRYGDNADTVLVSRLASYLESQQIDEDRGFDPTNQAYGGWGFGEKNLPPGNPGHVDLSHTRRVLQALSHARVEQTVFDATQVYLRRTQKRDGITAIATDGYDGGFFASPVVPGVNKGGLEIETDSTGAFYRSYATATSDGILALNASGVAPGDDRIQDALAWLWHNSNLSTPAGIPADSPIRWDEVMFFYHLYVRTDVYSIYGGPEGWEARVTDLLSGQQHPDGSFSNPAGSPNKEDDPLIASTFALNALLRTLGS